MSRTFRLTPKQRIITLTGGIPAFALLAVNGGRSILLVLGGAAIWFAIFWGIARMGATLTEEGVAVDGTRPRFVAWPAIQDVRTIRMLGSRFVVLMVGGRDVRLRAPVTGFLQQDAGFDDKYAEIVTWWHAHRGADWRPATGPPLWSLPTRRPTVVPSRAWPAQAATGVVSLAGAGVVAAVTWWPRADTDVGALTIGGGREPGTPGFLAGALALGVIGGLVVGWRASRRRPARVGAAPAGQVDPARGVAAALVAGLGCTAVIGLTTWFGAVPLMVPALFVAGALAVAVASLGSLGWLRRLEQDGPVPVWTLGPLWVPPGMAPVTTSAGVSL